MPKESGRPRPGERHASASIHRVEGDPAPRWCSLARKKAEGECLGDVNSRGLRKRLVARRLIPQKIFLFAAAITLQAARKSDEFLGNDADSQSNSPVFPGNEGL